jgi:hypothetical protein
LGSIVLALMFLQRPPIRREAIQKAPLSLGHYAIGSICTKLVYLPEAPRGYHLTLALRALGLVRPTSPRTDIVWEYGRFRYVNE